MSKDTKISCEEALERLFDYLDRNLDDGHRHEMETHLSVCRSCYSRVEFERHLQRNLRETGEQAAPRSLHERVAGLMKRF